MPRTVERLRRKMESRLHELYVELGTLEELREVAHDEVREIRWALDKVAHGEFGRCERCGAWIAEIRLAAVPSARKCVGCVEQDEVADVAGEEGAGSAR